MTILITGCAGFIGANFVEYLLSAYPEDRVVGVDCLTYAANAEALSRLCESDRFRFYKVDICDADAIEAIFRAEKPDVAVNFAAESHVDRSIADSPLFLRTNVLGVQVLLDASLRHGVKRFHQVSTDEVYGDLPFDSSERFTEDSSLRPSSPYSASKASADLIALSYMKTHGLPVSISRSANNYGRYQHFEKLIPMTILKLLSGEPVPIYGDGRNMRDWLFVEDNCRAIDLIIRAGDCEVYNVGADNLWENIDLVRRMGEFTGTLDAPIIFVPDRKGHDRKYAVSSEKLKNQLGWRPEANFDEKLRETVEWYKTRNGNVNVKQRLQK